MSIAAYRTVMRESESPRQIEKRLFSKMIGALEAHASEFDDMEGGRPADRLELLARGLRPALEENLRFWGALKHDLLSEGNQLPAETRSGLISLAFWVERKTARILQGEPGVREIVSVNRNIMNGLSSRAGA